MKSKSMVADRKSSAQVVIALSTYNGSKFLAELLYSLLKQDYPNFYILIRDDGSTDSTTTIIDVFCRNYPRKVVRLFDLAGNVGVTRSFLNLLDFVDDGSYLMFCDQDDVWFDDKISTFMAHMHEVEVGTTVPALVFGDMVVTDQNLNVLASSFWAYQRIDVTTASDWRRLMMSNVVAGCSSMFNSAAVSRLRIAPPLTLLHDHLAAIVVAKHGVVAPLRKPTMFYRQHINNVEGARAFGLSYLIGRFGYFVRVIVPRYRTMCKAFGVPLSLAAYLKFETVCKRLIKS